MSGFGLVVRFTLRSPQAAAAFDDLTAMTLQGIQASEPGTLVYASHEDQENALVRVFYELYQDRNAFELHEEQPHVKHFLAERGQHLDSFEVTLLSELAGKYTTSE
ncbi:antibiotic biosynthesis monooxygenase [Kitasatospora sp. NPDC002040]|uniref:putative quinol monooxygenase n=1 Tax=Kitasatospora sp. NPDC002040 TaxID=3154661 RepID=UPI00331EFBC0